MNKNILNTHVQEFINAHLNQDITKTILSGSPFAEVAIAEIADQIAAKKKCESKLPLWFQTPNIYFPPPLSVEQASSEITARYKAGLLSPGTLADLTGGMGVDCFYFSQNHQQTTYIESNPLLAAITHHNFEVLQAPIRCETGDGISLIHDGFFDTIYIDPSRRNQAKGKVFLLSDCQPNVVEQLNYLLSRCRRLLIKTSPMLDISAGLKELKNVHQLHIVAVNNEVKELLWLIQPQPAPQVELVTVNFKGEQPEFFTTLLGAEAEATYALPRKYLYEPNAALMKSGAFEAVSQHFGIDKLHKHSHLYTSDYLTDFPGRVFIIEKTVLYNKKEMKILTDSTAHVATRNFPLSATDLKKLWKIKDGGEYYYFFTTLTDNSKAVLLCKKP